MLFHFFQLFLGCCAVMSRKTSSAYRACFEAFQRLVPHINATLILANYEDNLRWGARQVYPAAYIAACNDQFERVSVLILTL